MSVAILVRLLHQQFKRRRNPARRRGLSKRRIPDA
jgi:hypothetical protein